MQQQILKDVSDLVEFLTSCDRQVAIEAGKEISNSPETLAKLAYCCGVGASQMAGGAALIHLSIPALPVGGAGVVGVGTGVVVAASGYGRAKLFCSAYVEAFKKTPSGKTVTSWIDEHLSANW